MILITVRLVFVVIYSVKMNSMKILLVDPAEQMSVHTLSEVKDITGTRAYMPNLALPTLAALAPR